MQLLTLAGSLFLVIYSVAAQGAGSVGPCEQARHEAGQPMPGKFIPQCTQYGFFKPAQCSGSTGKCWCVNPDTGKEVEGSSTFRTGPPQCTMCYIKRSEALRPVGTAGHYVPICDEDGLFDATQRHGSTGYSWCVNRYTGEEIPDSRTGPGQQRKISCGAAAHMAGLMMHTALPQQGPCYAKIVEARGREITPGFYTPKCTANGYYQTEQHHASTGYTWCVNPATGVEVEGTRRGPAQPRANCGACFKEIESKLSRQPRMGAELPQCNEENGQYVPVQHREGYSFCVNPQTGAVEGKKNPPGDNTPLPCVNH
jgi:nidogen (entactin)